jgi:hypothetical protein
MIYRGHEYAITNMDSQLHQNPIVRREWLPVFAIVWMSFTSLLVILRLTLRATSRNLGLDDVRGSPLPDRQYDLTGE